MLILKEKFVTPCIQYKNNRNTDIEQIYVTGPAVAGGTVSLGVAGTFRDDLTLAYA